MYFKVTYIFRGKRETKVVKANNQFEASKLVKQEKSNIVVISTVKTSEPIADSFSGFSKSFETIFKQKLSIDDKISFIRQTAVMTEAGIPIHDVLEDISKNTTNKTLKDILASIANDINAGKSMSQALNIYYEQMGHIVIAMTKLGEKTGNFPESYHKLADILESIRDNKNKFKKAMRYPVMVVISLVIAFVTVIMAVVPKFRQIFEELGGDLPVATKVLLSAESFFSSYGYLIIIFIMVVVFLHKHYYKNNRDYNYSVDRILAHPKFYLIGKLVYLSNIYNYTLVFGSLVKAGIPISEALETSIGVVDNLYIRKKLESINANISRGVSLSEALNQTELFENMTLQMIRAGESSGQLDSMLDKVSESYNMKFQYLIDNLSAYIEPIMIAMIAGLVLLLALGIFMPMWDLGKVAK